MKFKIDINEYNSLREELLQHQSRTYYYLIATISAITLITYWAIDNPDKIFIEILVVIQLIIILVSLNMMLACHSEMYLISTYIAVFYGLNNDQYNWEYLILKNRDRFGNYGLIGEPAGVLIILSILIIPIDIISKVFESNKLFGEHYLIYVILTYILFMAFCSIMLLRYKKITKKYLTSWNEISSEINTKKVNKNNDLL